MASNGNSYIAWSQLTADTGQYFCVDSREAEVSLQVLLHLRLVPNLLI